MGLSGLSVKILRLEFFLDPWGGILSPRAEHVSVSLG